MRRRGAGSPGFSLKELLVVAAMIAVLAAIGIPIFTLAVARARTAGVAEMLGAAIRDARMRAIATGWNFEVIGFDSTGPVPQAQNAFRIQGMDPNNGGVFPAGAAVTPPALYGINQMYEPYVNVAQEFGGTRIMVPGGTFTITFNSSGQLNGPCVPVSCQVQVVSAERSATVSVSVAGAVLIAK